MNDVAHKLERPVAPIQPEPVKSPHGTRLDPYYWLRDDTRMDTRVLGYLADENAYLEAVMAPLAPLQKQLYEELVGRIKQDDSTVPYLERGYYYYTRYITGGEYPIHARRRETMDAPEEILLDVPALATGHDFYQIAGFEISPNQQLLAWLEDDVGHLAPVRQYREGHASLFQAAQRGRFADASHADQDSQRQLAQGSPGRPEPPGLLRPRHEADAARQQGELPIIAPLQIHRRAPSPYPPAATGPPLAASDAS